MVVTRSTRSKTSSTQEPELEQTPTKAPVTRAKRAQASKIAKSAEPDTSTEIAPPTTPSTRTTRSKKATSSQPDTATKPEKASFNKPAASEPPKPPASKRSKKQPVQPLTPEDSKPSTLAKTSAPSAADGVKSSSLQKVGNASAASRSKRPPAPVQVNLDAAILKRQRKARSSTTTMLPLNISLAGVRVDGAPATEIANVQVIVDPSVDSQQSGLPVRGTSVSGRIHRPVRHDRASTMTVKVSTLQKTWDERSRERMEMKAWKQTMAELKAERDAEKQAERQRIEEKRKRKEENEKRSAILQRITNKNTLRKMSKKQVRQLLRA